MPDVEKTIVDLFENQAKERPDRAAVTFCGETLTYRQLNERSNQLANYLRRIGVKPETPVGLYVERSAEMIIALLGILKAGAFYVPLDRAFPQDRIEYMVADAGIGILLVQEKHAGRLSFLKAQRVAMECGEIWQGEAKNPAGEVVADNLAYLVYTSGSTGHAKGVAVTHGSVVRLVHNTDYARFGPNEVFLQFAPLTFDAATFEIWGALLNGAQLKVFPPETPSSEELGDWLMANSVSTIWLTAGLFHQLLERDSGRYFRHVQQLLAGGDVLSVPHVRRFTELYPHCNLINGYGPTENTTFSCCEQVRGLAESEKSVPIGKPIAYGDAYILDEELNELEAGSAGEICLSGAGLARGYWHQPGLTAEKFVPNPFSSRGERMYRSGDMGRYLRGGNIEFIGRIDLQVKLRGFRIELGEIDTVLAEHESLSNAVTIVREDVPGDKRLVAYVVPKSEVSVSELRGYAARKLPEYMVPSLFVTLAELPLTCNGKVDRSALPAPGGNRPALQHPYVAPGTPTERLVAEIWADILHVDRVGAQDSFLELGGHSLLGGQVVARLRHTCRVQVPLCALFEKPVLSDFANLVERYPVLFDSDGFPMLGPSPRNDRIPLSLSQERVWFLLKLEPFNTAYHFYATLKIEGPLDVEALRGSLDEMVRRHEILRTTFVEDNGRPRQVIHQPSPVTLPIVEVSASSDEERDHRLNGLMKQETSRKFELSTLPLIRWTLFKLSEDRYVLLHVEHHLIHDGWSFNVFLGELLTIYKAFAAGQPSPLPAQPIQFADFAIWQRRCEQSHAVQAQLAYWKDKLSGGLPVSELPTDFPRPETQSFQGAIIRAVVPLGLARKLRALSVTEETSLFVIMMAAFDGLAYLYTHQHDFCLGSTSANRQRPETEDLLGMLVNNQVWRTHLLDSQSWHDVVRLIHQLSFEAYENQDVGFQNVVQALKVDRDLSRNPLFQLMFSFHNAPVMVPEIPELRLELTEGLGNGGAKFDISVIVIPSSERRRRLNHDWDQDAIAMIWEYNTGLYSERTVSQLIRHYQTILECMTARPMQVLSDVCLLSEVEKKQILTEWSRSDVELRSSGLEGSVVAIVERMAALQARRLAIVGPDREMTYAELNECANQWAHFIQSRGIGGGRIIAVCLERSAAMIAASLGVMKAGAAYLPIDPTYPAERILFSLRDADAGLVITERHLRSVFRESSTEVTFVDDPGPVRSLPTFNLPKKPKPEDPAYVIYTSGSSGRPKGVLISHRSLVNLVLWHQDQYQLSPLDRASQFASPSFDASVWEIWPYLCSGASVVIVDEETRLSPERIKLWFAEHAITIGFLPTAVAELVIHEPWPQRIPLRTLLVGGDRLTRRPEPGNCFRVVNHYGPTEATVVATAGEVAPRDEHNRLPDIGRPIANCMAYVLDSRMLPVPAGVAGELYIGGEGVAIGYVHDPDRQNSRFLTNPFGPGRLYRSGDLVRFLADGRLEFIGRADEQVKIRGYRIELAEIKSVIEEQPSIEECAVVAEDGKAGKYLLAYVVARNGELDLDSLRSALQRRLPQYMVPSGFVPLSRLPLTPNGKLDRNQLRNIEPVVSTRTHVAPEGAAEDLLAAVWQKILAISEVSTTENFFELGGNSFVAIQVVNGAASQGFAFSVRDLFRFQTIRELASIGKWVKAPELGRTTPGGQTSWPTTPIQEWFFEHNFVNPTLWNASMLFQTSTELDVERLQVATKLLFKKHPALNLQFRKRDGGWIQVPADENDEAVFQYFDFSSLDPAEQSRQLQDIGNELQNSFSFGKGKLVRFAYFDLGSSGSRFLIVAHHLICDGMSLGVLITDLTSIYGLLASGEPVADASARQRGTSFVDWAQRVNSEDAIQRSMAELPFWANRENPPIPTDFAGGENTFDSIKFHHVEIGADESSRLISMAHKKFRAGVDVILLWAAASALTEWLKTRGVLICMVGHGREVGWEDIDLSRTVGFCNVHYPLYLELSEDMEPAGAVVETSRHLDRVPNHGIGYGILRFIHNVRESSGRIDLLPEPEIGFNYLGDFDVRFNQNPLFNISREKAGSGRDLKCAFPYKMSIFSYILNGQVHADWIFSTNLYGEETIERLSAAFKKNLHLLECTSEELGPGRTADLAAAADLISLPE